MKQRACSASQGVAEPVDGNAGSTVPPRSRSLLAVLLLAGAAPLAEASVNANAKAPALASRGFNFSYQTEGTRRAAPTQVFDDGRRTYLQFNALDRVPEIWTEEGRGRTPAHRIASHLQSPYVIIDQVLPRLRLVVDSEDTVLVNQAWGGVNRTDSRSGAAPIIWTDVPPFGPLDPPAPAAQTAQAAPSREPLPGLALAGAAAGPDAAQPAGGFAARRVVTASAQTQAGPLSPHNAVRDEDDAERPVVVPRNSTLSSGETAPLQSSDAQLDNRMEALRREAAALLQQAEQTHQPALEQTLRKTLAVIVAAQERQLLEHARARQPAAPGPAPYDPPQPTMVALADTRPRSDVTPQEVPASDGYNHDDHPDNALRSEGPGRPVRQKTLQFEVRDNQRLSQALSQFLEGQGWRLEWESQSDFVVRRGYTVRGNSLKEVLLAALGEFRLSAVLYSGNLVVAVSGGER